MLLFLAIVLFVLIRFTDSDYHFGIFNLFFPDTILSSVCSKSNLLPGLLHYDKSHYEF